MQNNLWVRLKPRNEKKGILLRRYSAFGMRFDEQMGWYKVPPVIELSDGRKVDVSAYLKSVRTDNEDSDSPLAFDVMNEQEARSLDAQERKAAEMRASAVDARPVHPVDMTTADLSAPPEAADAEATPGVSGEAPDYAAAPIRPRRGRPPKQKAS